MEYSCAFSRALCDFSVTKGTHDPKTHQTTVSAYLKHPVHLATPSMAGNLMICTGPMNMFWKSPLIINDLVHPDVKQQGPTITLGKPLEKPGKYFCAKINPAAPQVSVDILVPTPPNSATGEIIINFQCHCLLFIFIVDSLSCG